MLKLKGSVIAHLSDNKTETIPICQIIQDTNNKATALLFLKRILKADFPEVVKFDTGGITAEKITNGRQHYNNRPRRK